MADTKQETTVENPEQQQAEETSSSSPRKSISPGLEGLQIFYEKNKNLVNYLGGGLLVLIAGLLYFKLFYLPEKETEAANELYHAQRMFEKDSFSVALRGGMMVMSPDGQKQMMGFEQIADEFSLTRSGNLANFYAGICLLRTGKFDEAIEFLGKYDGKDLVLGSVAIGAIGDAHMEMNRTEDAIRYYLKAADRKSNSFTTPLYLKKAALAQELNKDFAGALNSYERIQHEFPDAREAAEIGRDISRIKALGNIE